VIRRQMKRGCCYRCCYRRPRRPSVSALLFFYSPILSCVIHASPVEVHNSSRSKSSGSARGCVFQLMCSDMIGRATDVASASCLVRIAAVGSGVALQEGRTRRATREVRSGDRLASGPCVVSLRCRLRAREVQKVLLGRVWEVARLYAAARAEC